MDYSTKEKRFFIKRVCKDLGIHYVSDSIHKFGTGDDGYFSMQVMFKCRTLNQAFIYAQGLDDANKILQTERKEQDADNN
tara:strand:- start:197 stop:436 length:240 start_codon:yes stop_codon:yes gene_type:complete